MDARPGRACGFLLLAQKKVTKENGARRERRPVAGTLAACRCRATPKLAAFAASDSVRRFLRRLLRGIGAPVWGSGRLKGRKRKVLFYQATG